ncbi:MAG: hypothetical protein K1X56_05360 [Flavobacteriales bacterium]|nr:hypothetical protein [Flavobacteriales bacterium]
MNWPSKIVLFLLGITGLSSCLDPVQFPPEPAIVYSHFEQYGDTGVVFITFTDGDGDIGLDENQTSPPYDTSSIYYYNLFIKYYEKVDGVFQQGIAVDGSPIAFNFRVQNITPDGQNKALQGEIRVTLAPSFYNPLSADSDTIMYKIQLCDRALHMSNEVESEVIIR